LFSLDGKNILIVGIGKTGVSIVKHLCRHYKNIRITTTDMKETDKLPSGYQEIRKYIFKETFGRHEKEDFEWADIVFLSPGVDLNKLPFTPSFNKEIINDIELAFRNTNSTFIGITGSNGKSTTTKMVYELFKKIDSTTLLCGNWGTPILDEINKQPDSRVLVCELSSFQLESVVEFSPQCILFLNLSEDHLDRYRTYDEYISAKERILSNSKSLKNLPCIMVVIAQVMPIL